MDLFGYVDNVLNFFKSVLSFKLNFLDSRDFNLLPLPSRPIVANSINCSINSLSSANLLSYSTNVGLSDIIIILLLNVNSSHFAYKIYNHNHIYSLICSVYYYILEG